MEALGNVKCVLVAGPDSIRDVIMLSPSLRALRRALPKARLTLLVSQAGAGAAALLPGVDEIFVHHAPWQETHGEDAFGPVRDQAVVWELRRRQFDAALIFASFVRSPYPTANMCYRAGIPVRVAQSRECDESFLTHCVRPPPNTSHQVDRNLHLLAGLGIPIGGASAMMPRLSPTQEAATGVDSLLREHGVRGDFVVIAPDATCGARRYPLARYIDVATRLQQTGHRIVVAGGVADKWAGEALVSAVPGTVSLCGLTSLSGLVALLRRAQLLIANDSPFMYLADAVGCPMVILYSGTELEAHWQPRTTPARLLRCPTACSPCYRSECPYDRECLAVAPSDVAAEAIGLLGEGLRAVADG